MPMNVKTLEAIDAHRNSTNKACRRNASRKNLDEEEVVVVCDSQSYSIQMTT